MPIRSPKSSIKTFGAILFPLLTLALPGCVLKTVEPQDSYTESEFLRLQSNCGGSRNFLFSNVETKIQGRNEKDWGCWYAASSNKVYATLTDEQLRQTFSTARPIVKHYVNMNTLTKRLADIDSQRSTILWLGIGVAMLGCGVAAGGTFGLALAGCALLGSATAGYDIFGGDPSQGAAEAWRKMAAMTPEEVTKLECNATKTIAEHARFIDAGGLLNKEGSSNVSCPSVKTLLSKYDKISGIQVGAYEIKTQPQPKAKSGQR